MRSVVNPWLQIHLQLPLQIQNFHPIRYISCWKGQGHSIRYIFINKLPAPSSNHQANASFTCPKCWKLIKKVVSWKHCLKHSAFFYEALQQLFSTPRSEALSNISISFIPDNACFVCKTKQNQETKKGKEKQASLPASSGALLEEEEVLKRENNQEEENKYIKWALRMWYKLYIKWRCKCF